MSVFNFNFKKKNSSILEKQDKTVKGFVMLKTARLHTALVCTVKYFPPSSSLRSESWPLCMCQKSHFQNLLFLLSDHFKKKKKTKKHISQKLEKYRMNSDKWGKKTEL